MIDKDYSLKSVELVNVGVVKILVRFKNTFDTMLGKQSLLETNGVAYVDTLGDYESIVDLYIELGDLIKRSNLSKFEKSVITGMLRGMTENEIAEVNGVKLVEIFKLFQSACEKIADKAKC